MSCKLLQNTRISIQDVASSVGIEDACYFTKQFKKAKGLSPTQFRKQCLNGSAR